MSRKSCNTKLGRRTINSGLGLVEIWVDYLDGMLAMYRTIKVPLPGGAGRRYIASYLIPRANCSAMIKISADEGPEPVGARP